MRKNCLVTGGAGFIGHHLIHYLLQQTDWNIVCLDRLDTAGNLNRIDEILKEDPSWNNRFQFVYHDLKAELNSQISKQIGPCHIIYHLAASSHVDRSIEDPLSFVYDNVVGTCNLLNFAKNQDHIEYIQCFSSDEVFGNAPEGVSYKEWDRHKPRNAYSASKSGADQLAYSYHIMYGLPIVVTNCMNVIGIRQHPEKALPMFIDRILNGETVYIHAYPDKSKAGSRFYVHAENVAHACYFLYKNAEIGERYNLPGQLEVSNLELAQNIADILERPLKYKLVDFHANRPGHDLRYALDGATIYDMGYNYPLRFASGFENIVKWTVNNKKWLVA